MEWKIQHEPFVHHPLRRENEVVILNAQSQQTILESRGFSENLHAQIESFAYPKNSGVFLLKRGDNLRVANCRGCNKSEI